MVEIVDATPDVLVWNLPHDANGLPERCDRAGRCRMAIVALTDTHPSRWFDEALALGVDEVLCPAEYRRRYRWAWPLGQGQGECGAAAPLLPRSRDLAKGHRAAHVFTVFSTKGGSGRR